MLLNGAIKQSFQTVPLRYIANKVNRFIGLGDILPKT